MSDHIKTLMQLALLRADAAKLEQIIDDTKQSHMLRVRSETLYNKMIDAANKLELEQCQKS